MISKIDWKQIEPAYRALLERGLRSVEDLVRFLHHRGEIDAHVDEVGARTYDRTRCDTADESAKRDFLVFVEQVQPKFDAMSARLDKKILDSPWSKELDPEEYGVFLRGLQASVETYSEKNIPLESHEKVLTAEYSEVVGAMTVELDDEILTLPAAAARLECPEAAERERAWVAACERRLADAERIDGIYSGLVELRDRMARNAGFEDYRGLAFLQAHRFDYTPDDCLAFHAGVEEHFVPLQQALWEQRRGRLGLDRLRPWDLMVSPDGGDPLAPFQTVRELTERTGRVFNELDEELGALFASLCDGKSLDLESRRGKAPGGYQNTYLQTKGVFIFMNAVGIQQDVKTLLHEGGHAFHALLASEQPLLAYRTAGAEFSEVASMSMELLAHPYLGAFYAEDDVRRARRMHLERIVMLFPWAAQIDAFQHWVYAHPAHTAGERAETWRELGRRFRPGIDWSGHEEAEGRDWHRVPHFFSHPFYYIEYGIAQLGALGLWQNALEDEAAALEHYKRALRLGGSRPLPELFRAAGLEFDLGPRALGRAADLLRESLALG